MKTSRTSLKNWHVNAAFWVFTLSAYLLTRLVNLKLIPIFTDEAIYAYWAQVALNDPAHRFISLEDGKQPFFIWLAAAYQQFISDPLIASRLVSVTAGLFSLIGIYLLAKFMFDKKVALISSLLYVFSPFTLLYDRLALYDSLLAALGIYAVLLTVRVVKKPQLDMAILNGAAIGLATITKSSGFFLLYFLPASLLFINLKGSIFKNFFKWALMTAVTVFIVTLFYNMLRLSPLFYLIARKNMEFIRSFEEVINDPLFFAFSNAHAIFSWLIAYAGVPLFIIFLIGVVAGLVKRDKRIIYLGFLIFAPIGVMVLFNKVLYPRFVLFYFPYFLVICAYSLQEVNKKFLKNFYTLLLVILVCLSVPTYSSFKLLTQPTKSLIPTADKSQLLNEWPAGYGAREVVTFIDEKSRDGDVYIGTEGTFGLFPFSLNIYFYGNDRVHVSSYWPVKSNELPQDILEKSKAGPTYFVFNETQQEINNPKLKFLEKYRKGEGNSYMRLYEVIR